MLSRVLELYLTRSEFYLGLVGQHLKIAGIAIVISIVVGVGIGVLIYMVPKLAPAVTGVINVVYTIPSEEVPFRHIHRLERESGVKLRDVGQASYSTMTPSI